MPRQNFPYRSDSVVRLVAPTDSVNGNPLDNTNDGATASFKVYDPLADEQLSAVEASGQTELSVSNAGIFNAGDAVELLQNDGSAHSSTVSSVDPIAGTVTVADPTTVAAAAGSRFRRRFGGVVTMTEYGVSKIGERDWGFQGTLGKDSPAVAALDREFDVEITFVGAVAGGLDVVHVICGITKPIGECS